MDAPVTHELVETLETLTKGLGLQRPTLRRDLLHRLGEAFGGAASADAIRARVVQYVESFMDLRPDELDKEILRARFNYGLPDPISARNLRSRINWLAARYDMKPIEVDERWKMRGSRTGLLYNLAHYVATRSLVKAVESSTEEGPCPLAVPRPAPANICRCQPPPIRRFDVHEAIQWLGYLAVVSNGIMDGRFDWWRLIHTTPRTKIRLAGWIAGLSVAWIVTTLLGGKIYPEPSGAANGVEAVLVCVMLFPLLFGIQWWPRSDESPRRLRFHLSPLRPDRLVRGLLSDLFPTGVHECEFGGATTAGFAAISAMYLPRAIGEGRAVGIGFAVWGVVLLVRYLSAAMTGPIDLNSVSSPTAVLRLSRHVAFFKAGLAVILAAPMVVLCYLAADGKMTVQDVGWTIMAAILVGLWCGLDTAWGNWLQARLALAATRKRPWALIHFLEDQCERGELCREGASYKFKEEASLTSLAETHMANLSRKERRQTWALFSRWATAMDVAERGDLDSADAELRAVHRVAWLRWPWSRSSCSLRLFSRYGQALVRSDRGKWDIHDAEAEFRTLCRLARSLDGTGSLIALECEIWLADVLVEARRLEEAKEHLDSVSRAALKLGGEAAEQLDQDWVRRIGGRQEVFGKIKALAGEMQATDDDAKWRQLLRHYDELYGFGCSVHDGMVRARVAYQVLGAEEALTRLEDIEPIPRLAAQETEFFRLKGHLLECLGRLAEATAAYDAARSAGARTTERPQRSSPTASGQEGS